MVREQAQHLVVSEQVGGEAVQCALGAGFDEDPGAGLEQGLQALDELHGGGDLAPEDLDHALFRAGPRRVELPVDVRDDRDLRGRDVEPAQHLPQRLGGGGDDLSVEGVADRQPDPLVSALGQ